jgi:hypothetical protein
VSFSLRRLRTTPAKKPRTECCCQPVARIIVAIVAPAGDRSSASTRDCLVPEAALFGSAVPPLADALAAGPGSAAAPVVGFVVALRLFTAGSGLAPESGLWRRAGSGFLADFATRSSIRLCGYPHHRSPTTAMTPAGRDPTARSAPEVADSTAPFPAGGQSFLTVETASDVSSQSSIAVANTAHVQKLNQP